MSSYSNTAFLCAYFSIDGNTGVETILASEGWRRQHPDDDIIRTYKQYFYPEFVDFCMGTAPGMSVGTYTRTIDQAISVGGKEVLIKNITIYIMPYGLALYSIHTEQHSDNPNDFTLSLFRMRELRNWDHEELTEFHTTAIQPLATAAGALGYVGQSIIENGNKLKVFQIVTTVDMSGLGDDMDTLLFELGTLGRVGGCSQNAPDSPSGQYTSRILKENSLSFYNNWKGLALFDTFTMLGFGVKPWVLETWSTDYFSMIYIHSLYCKFYLFRLNTRFRAHPEEGDALEGEYNDFERLYTFHRLSYNFLPNEIDKAIDKALEISEEQRLISAHISDYNKLKGEESSKRLDKLLTFLTIVTVFSTVWDFSSMINAMVPFDAYTTTAENGFRLIVSVTIVTLVVAVLLMLRKPHRK